MLRNSSSLTSGMMRNSADLPAAVPGSSIVALQAGLFSLLFLQLCTCLQLPFSVQWPPFRGLLVFILLAA